MLKLSNGKLIDPTVPIFPLFTYLPKEKLFKCLGTGFFISHMGGFVTAKHVFFDNDGNHIPSLYAVQTLQNGKRILRRLLNLSPHPKADIIIGMLGNVVDINGKPIYGKAPVTPAFSISLREIEVDDKITTYAFPRTQTKHLSTSKQQFTFTCSHSSGRIVEYCPDGSPIVKNPCYHTSMKILDGASGGPVIRNGAVIGVNSSSFDLAENEEPISYITPISLLTDLKVKDGNEILTVTELIEEGYIRNAN